MPLDDVERFPLALFLPELQKFGESDIDLVVVGGQAVNFWADRYQHHESKLLDFLPFVSKDIDLLGAATEFVKMASMVAGRHQRFGDIRQSVIGVVETSTDPVLKFELLRTIYGPVSAGKIAVRSHRKNWIKVMDPLSLFVAKCHNSAGIDQTRRQDIRHVQMMTLVVRSYFVEIVDAVGTQITPRQFINECKYLLEFTGNAVFQKGLALAGASLPECFPLEKIATLGEKYLAIGRFYANCLWPALREVGSSGPVEGL